MKFVSTTCAIFALGMIAWYMTLEAQRTRMSNDPPVATEQPPVTRAEGIIAERIPQPNQRVISDPFFQLCQGYEDCGCEGVCDGSCRQEKWMAAVDDTCRTPDREPNWKDARLIPFEAFAYGEYIGPHRTPHVPEYRLRVNDRLEFVYLLTRKRTGHPYRLFVGDVIEISSSEQELRQTNINVLPDGTISLDLIGQVRAEGKSLEALQRELNQRYLKLFKDPSIVVRPIQSNTPLNDFRDAVDARQGQGGQSREAVVSPDGTIQLPLVGSIPAIGLTLEEIQRETNARYNALLPGLNVTPILLQRAPRFIYVVGEVGQPGRFELTGPTSVMQSLALAQGFNQGGNLRQVIVFRRDQNWRLVATKLDLAGAMFGRRPQPSDEIWLRDSDIVLVPKKPIQRLSEAVDLYLTRTIYSTVPQEIIFDFNNFSVSN